MRSSTFQIFLDFRISCALVSCALDLPAITEHVTRRKSHHKICSLEFILNDLFLMIYLLGFGFPGTL